MNSLLFVFEMLKQSQFQALLSEFVNVRFTDVKNFIKLNFLMIQNLKQLKSLHSLILQLKASKFRQN